jgi:Tol biopolymer transport system component
MYKRPNFWIITVMCWGLLGSAAFAQNYYFGKNKVQYSKFDWSYIQSEHFDIYFYDGGEDLADFTADISEDALEQLQGVYRYRLRNRIPILVYNSHNDFQQTNAIDEFMSEGIGGVTEVFKNRIVVPFEGNYEKFRHVIHHELNHGFINDMFYGDSFPNRIYAVMQFQMPLWANEGLSEFNSRGWSTDHDDSMRDAAINDYLDYASPYWGGNAIWNYIAKTYGQEKVGEVVRRIRETSDVDDGLKRALGLEFEDLFEEWKLHSQRRYWPDLANRNRPDEVAKQLTDHEDGDGVYNLSPVISPNGDKIAFFSTRDLYYDMYIMSAIDGKIINKLVEGNRSPEFEELHIIGPLNLATPALAWSPDGRQIAFASKTGEFDALFVVDIRTRKHTRYDFNLDGVWSPTWSPNGETIAFVGSKAGYSDIYGYNMLSQELTNLTDDVFSDSDPNWSPDGNRLAFNSDRGEYVRADMVPDDFKIKTSKYDQLDVYVMDADGGRMERVTATDYDEHSPVWYPDSKGIAYIADEIGIGNIYLHDFETHESRPITNLLSGALHLSWSRDGSKLAFTALNNQGYDVYMLKNPFEIESDEIELQETVYFKEKREQEAEFADRKELNQERLDEANQVLAEGTVLNPNETGDIEGEEFSSYVFDENVREENGDDKPDDLLEEEELNENFLTDESEYKNGDGSYAKKRYKLRFTPDALIGGAGYDAYLGVQGQTMILFSDLMGNHQVGLGADLFGDLKNSSFMASYGYFERKTDFRVMASHQVMFLNSNMNWLSSTPVNNPTRLRSVRFGIYMSRPFNRFSRVELGFEYSRLSQTYYSDSNLYYQNITPNGPESTVHVVGPSLTYIKDTTLPGYFGPMDGFRSILQVRYSPPLSKSYRDPNREANEWAGAGYTTVLGDARKYYKMGINYSFAFRITGGASFGRNPEAFYLGGIDNWLNRSFKNGVIRDGLDDIYFGNFITPLRGLDYYGLQGTRFTAANFEFRFPMVQYLLLGWPLPLGFQNIRGAGFFDIGTAWVGNDFQMWTDPADDPDGEGREYYQDFGYGFGFGVRAALFFIPVRWDVAWTNNGQEFIGPRYLWSIGLEF